MKIKKERTKRSTSSNWVFKITIIAFLLSLIFSFLAETVLPNVPVILELILLLVVIGLGIIFDMIGIAVATANERVFHSMSSKGLKEAKVSVMLKKNADKTASFCNDVIGDVCGIISGSAGAIIAVSISNKITAITSFTITLTITAIIAAITIGGKAMCKTIAMEKSEEIVKKFSKIISIFYAPKNN